MLLPDERHPEEQRLFDQLLEPALIGETRVPKAQLAVGARLMVDQRAYAELLDEAPQLAGRSSTLDEIHEVRLHAALGKEPQGFSRVRALLNTEDLNFQSSLAPKCPMPCSTLLLGDADE